MTRVQNRLIGFLYTGNSLFFPWLVCSLLAIGILVYATRWGVGTSPDSAAYLGVASNLYTGKGLTVPYGQNSGTITAHFPPLYPLFLTLGNVFNDDLIFSTRWLHAGLISANLLITGFFFRQMVSRSNWLPGLALLPLAVSATMMRLYYMAWSEGLFLFFGFLGLLLTVKGISDRNSWWLLAGGTAAGAAVLTRYAGVTFVATIALGLMIFSNLSFRRRITSALISIIPTAIMLTGWIIYSGAAGSSQPIRSVSFHLPGIHSLQQAVDTMSSWLLIPGHVPGVVKSFLLIIFILAIITLAVIYRSRSTARQSTAALLLAIFFLIYPLFLFLSLTFFDANTPLDARILSPMLVAGAGLVIYSLGMIFSVKFSTNLAAAGLLIIGTLLYSFISVQRTADLLRDAHNYGIGFTREQWQESQLIAIIEQIPGELLIYTNTAEGIYLNTGKSAKPLPQKINQMLDKENQAFQNQLAEVYQQVSEGSAVIAYFYAVKSPALLTRDEVLRMINDLPYVETQDGIFIGKIALREG